MKYILPILFSLPTALILLLFIVGPFLDFAPANETDQWLTRLSSTIAFLVFLPVLGFAACVAMMFIRPEDRVWKIATVFNLLPIAFVFLIFTFFWIIG